MDGGGDGYTTMGMDLMSLTVHLKTVKTVSFMCILPQ